MASAVDAERKAREHSNAMLGEPSRKLSGLLKTGRCGGTSPNDSEGAVIFSEQLAANEKHGRPVVHVAEVAWITVIEDGDDVDASFGQFQNQSAVVLEISLGNTGNEGISQIAVERFHTVPAPFQEANSAIRLLDQIGGAVPLPLRPRDKRENRSLFL